MPIKTAITPKTASNSPTVPEGKVPVTAKLKNGAVVTVLMDADDVVKEQFGGFVNFVREHAIVGLAIGFVVGQQAQGIIKQLLTSFIDPTFQLLFGKSLSKLTFTLSLGTHTATYKWGEMLHVLLNLIFVLLTIYLLIKIFKLDKLDKTKDADAKDDKKDKKSKKASKKSTKEPTKKAAAKKTK